MCGTDPFVLSFKAGSALIEQPDGSAILRLPNAEVPLEQTPLGLLTALRVLSTEGATAERLMELVAQYDGVSGPPQLLSILQRLTKCGMLCHTIMGDRGRLATLVPMSSAYQGPSDIPICMARYVLSRFVYLRTDGTQFVLESPLAYAKMVLHDWRATALLHACVTPHSLQELCGEFPDIPPDSVTLFWRLLLSCHALAGVSDNGQTVEEQPTLQQWHFHDLLFHAKSRLGRHDAPYGATYTYADRIDPPPVVKPPMSDDALCLYKPDIHALEAHDIPFTHVLERRRSIRKHGTQPLTVKQLGEFFYRTARIRSLSEAGSGTYVRSDRPYPNGGACYELELYPVVNACDGLSSGFYHYCPQTHQLYKVTGRTPHVEALLEGAYYAADQQGMPQILIVLAVRFQRVAWQYESIAYALTLKHVGVLYQTMSLVATAMGLSACALGGGNSDLFCVAAGTNYYAETSVGEFILGSKMGV